MASAFGLQQPQVPSYSSKERSAVLSHDRDILSRDRDYARDRDYYNSKVALVAAQDYLLLTMLGQFCPQANVRTKHTEPLTQEIPQTL